MGITEIADFVQQLHKKYDDCNKTLRTITHDIDKHNQILANHYFEIALLYMQFYETHKKNFDEITKNVSKCKKYLSKSSISDEKFKILFEKAAKIDEELQQVLQQETYQNKKYEFEIIVLGKTENTNLIKLSLDLQKDINDIELIKNINLIEDKILFIDKNYVEHLFHQYLSLSDLYSRAGQKSISDKYKLKIRFEELLDSSDDDEDIGDMDIIDNIVKTKIKNYQSSLKEILKEIKTNLKIEKILSTDEFIIKRKYIKFCLEFWYEEIEETLTNCIKFNVELFIQIFRFSKMQNIDNRPEYISKYFINLKFNKLLLENTKFMSTEDRNNLRYNFQSIFYFLVAKSNSEPCPELIRNTFLENVVISADYEPGTTCQYIEVKGEIIVLSLILPKIIDMIRSNNKIKEIRFLIENTFHINSNLDKSVFHGKNIVVGAHNITIHGDSILWDLSGIDRLVEFVTDAGQANGYGKDGLNGKPGESGGNVWLHAIEYNCPEKFVIMSNGGNGSNGQNGGKGKDGENGHAITFDELRSQFPSAAELQSTSNYEQNLSSIRALCRNFDPGENEKKSHGILSNFVHTKMPENPEIIFSYYKNLFYTKAQAFLVFKGSSGQKGLPGGEGGLGGHGGYEGNIIANNNFIKTINRPGKDGTNGANGPNGKHGCDGCDMGYIDCAPYVPQKNRPKYYGQYGNVKLFIDYSSDKGKRKIWCEFAKKYAQIRFEVTTYNPLCDYQVENELKLSRKALVPSEKQAAIKENTKETYRNYVDNSELNITSSKTRSEEIEKNISMNVNVQRSITFEHRDKLTEIFQTFEKTYPTASLFAEIENIPEIVRNIISNFKGSSKILKAAPLELNHLNEIYLSFAEYKDDSRSCPESISEIEKILINKYRFAAFREINRIIQIPNLYQNPETETLVDRKIECQTNIEIEKQLETETTILPDTPKENDSKTIPAYFPDNLRLSDIMTNSKLSVIISKLIIFNKKRNFDKYLEQISSANWNEETCSYLSISSKYENIEDIVQHFPSHEQNLLRYRLNKITSEYIGNQFILFSLRKQFLYEGRQVSTAEIISLIDDILLTTIRNDHKINRIAWILFAYPQKRWTEELLLLTLENFLGECFNKTIFRGFFLKIKNKDILMLIKIKLEEDFDIVTEYISEKHICSLMETIFELLSSITTDIKNITDLPLNDWPYALKPSYWESKLSKLLDSNIKKFAFQKIVASILKIDDACGTEAVNNFLESINGIILDPELEEFLKVLLIIESDESKISENYKALRNESNRNERNIFEIMKSNSNTSPSILKKLSKIERYMSRMKDSPIMTYSLDKIKKWTKDNRYNLDKFFVDELVNINLDDEGSEILAVISRAVYLLRGFQLSQTQLLAILCFCGKKYTSSNKTFAQVMTGEGKTLIIVGVAIIYALRGKKVNIVTSSKVLAQRDAMNNQDLYNLFGLSLSHNSSEKISERNEIYETNLVIYGVLETFIQDSLLKLDFFKRNTEKVMIIDEVDSIALDQSTNILYLSHNIDGLDRLDSVYIFIWRWLHRPAENLNDLEYNFDMNAIKDAILYDIFGIIKKDDIGRIDPGIGKQKRNEIWAILVESKVINERGELLCDSFNDTKQLEMLLNERNLEKYNSRIRYLVYKCINRYKHIHVPNYLKMFVKDNIQFWVKSAINALRLQEGEEYIVDIDRTGTSSDINPRILIIDKSTGTDISNAQWSNGLHQFLQLKHGCKLSQESLKAFFKTNICFFDEYDTVIGLTGTFGKKQEVELLKLSFAAIRKDIDYQTFFIIPLKNKRRFVEYDPIVSYNENEWIDKIYEKCKELVEKNRSVLIVCETILSVEKIYTKLKNCTEVDFKKLYKYTRDFQQFPFLEPGEVLAEGSIIVATNLAGRGTDIKISSNLNELGGLHVCLTFVPNNIRIEQQAFGRAARKGQNGSGQQIILLKNEQNFESIKFETNSIFYDLKKFRDYKDLHRLSLLRKYLDNEHGIYAEAGINFAEKYTIIENKIKEINKHANYNSILLQAFKDRFAYKVHKLMGARSHLLRNPLKMHNYLNQLFLRFETEIDFKKWVENFPVQETKLGIRYLINGKDNAYKKALDLFDKVIISEPDFCEAAHYYKAIGLAKQKPEKILSTKDLIMSEFLNAEKLFRRNSTQAIYKAQIVKELGIFNSDRLNLIEGFYNQQISISNIYKNYIESIDNILGHKLSPDTLSQEIKIKIETAELIFKHLIDLEILTKSKITQKHINFTDIVDIAKKYGISSTKLHNLIKRYDDGRDVNEEIFFKDLKETIPIPSREDFWNQLVKKKILENEVEYCIMDLSKLENVDKNFAKTIKDKIYKEENYSHDHEKFVNYLKKSKNIFETQVNNEIFLYPVEQININEDTESTILIKQNRWFINCCGHSIYIQAQSLGAVKLNKKANLNEIFVNEMYLENFDSINYEDIIMENHSESKNDIKYIINKEEAENILNELLDLRVINKKGNLYRLLISYKDIDNIKLIKYSVYEDWVKNVMKIRFSYRNALEILSEKQKNKSSDISIKLQVNPHDNLIVDLIDNRVFKPIGINRRDYFYTYERWLEENYEISDDQPINSYQLIRLCDFLDKGKSELEIYENRNWSIKLLSEIFEKRNFESIAEINLFNAFGLEHIINEDETEKLKRNTSGGLILGTSEFTTGILLCFVNSVLLKYFNTTFLFVSGQDIIYSTESLKSNFWEGFNNTIYRDASVLIFGNLFMDCLMSASLAAIRLKLGASRNNDIPLYIERNILEKNKAEIYDIEISNYLKIAYEKLGAEQASKEVNEITEVCFNRYTGNNISVPFLSNLRKSVENILNQAAHMSKYKEGTLKDICENVKIFEKSILIKSKIKTINQRILDDLKKQLNWKFNPDANKNTIYNSKKLNNFVEKFRKNWCDQLASNITKILNANSKLGKPEISNKTIVNYFTLTNSKFIKKYYKNQKKFADHFIQNMEIKNFPHQLSNNFVSKKYSYLVLLLMKILKSSTLLARIIQENITLDFDCVNSCNKIIKKMFQITGITIIIKDENNEVLKVLSSISENKYGSTVEVIYTENGYVLENNQNLRSNEYIGNYELFAALSEVLPQTCSNQITSEKLQSNIVEYIYTNLEDTDISILSNCINYSANTNFHKCKLSDYPKNENIKVVEEIFSNKCEDIFLQRRHAFKKTLSKLNKTLYQKLEEKIFSVTFYDFKIRKYHSVFDSPLGETNCVLKQLPSLLWGSAQLNFFDTKPIEIKFEIDFGTNLELPNSKINSFNVKFKTISDEELKKHFPERFPESISGEIVCSADFEGSAHSTFRNITEIVDFDLFAYDARNELKIIFKLPHLDCTYNNIITKLYLKQFAVSKDFE